MGSHSGSFWDLLLELLGSKSSQNVINNQCESWHRKKWVPRTSGYEITSRAGGQEGSKEGGKQVRKKGRKEARKKERKEENKI